MFTVTEPGTNPFAARRHATPIQGEGSRLRRWARVAPNRPEVTYALDDFCDSVSPVVARTRKFVHARRIHPHSSGRRGRSTSDPTNNGSQTGGLKQGL